MTSSPSVPQERSADAPLAGRAALRALAIIAGAIGLVTAFYCLLVTSWSVSSPVDGGFAFSVPVALPADSTNLIDTQFSDEHLTAGYEGDTWIRTDAPLVMARVLTGAATALPFLVVMTGCVGVIVLARRLGLRRPFTRALRWTLGLLGALTATSAICIPWFEKLAVESAVAALGLPTSGDMVQDADTDAWVVPAGFDPLQDLNWPFFLLGVVLILVSVLLVRASRMQRDTDGLI